MHLQSIVKALLIGNLLIAGCGESDSPAQVDAAPTGGSTATLADYAEAVCVWQSACVAGEGLEGCFALLREDSIFVDPAIHGDAFEQVAECVGAATSCSEYLACPSLDPLLSGPVGDHQCPGGKELVCDPADDLLLVCFDNEAGEAPILVIDIGKAGLGCFPGDTVGDDPEESCSSFRCNGNVREVCSDEGRVVSQDCTGWDKDFSCTADQECGLASTQCPDNTFNNSGGSAQCSGTNTATVCMSNKTYEVSCPGTSTCVDLGQYDARCQLP